MRALPVREDDVGEDSTFGLGRCGLGLYLWVMTLCVRALPVCEDSLGEGSTCG